MTKITCVVASFMALASQSAFAAEEKNAFQKYVLDGGPTMIPIGLAIAALVTLCIFNFLNLSKSKFVPAGLKAALLEHMANCRVRSAIELGASDPSYLGRLTAYALPNIDATRPDDLGRDKVEDAIADFAVNENRRNMTWVNYVSLIAQAAPMLGLLGTVMGMVGAFSTLETQGAGDPSELAGDISVALLTTMWGLITAIPSLLAYFFFKNRLNNLTSEAHNSIEEMINASVTTINPDAHLSKIPEGLA